jgi:hypothetical protein
MVSEEQLGRWTGPSSPTEKEKQDRTERMIREAIDAHDAFSGVSLTIYAKGSYANNTNVKADSDVDIAVECQEVVYYRDRDPNADHSGVPYAGIWTPQHLRSEIESALRAKFPGSVDTTGSTALRVNSNTARVDADVVPCFRYVEYFANGQTREGARVFKNDHTFTDNYSKLQLLHGTQKNTRTNHYYKKAVRILKRLENVLVVAGLAEEMPSYLMECLIYNCPDEYFLRSTWRSVMQGCLADIYNYTMTAEPSEESDRWMEVNEVKFLFHSSQKWTREDVHAFASAAWEYMEFDA